MKENIYFLKNIEHSYNSKLSYIVFQNQKISKLQYQILKFFYNEGYIASYKYTKLHRKYNKLEYDNFNNKFFNNIFFKKSIHNIFKIYKLLHKKKIKKYKQIYIQIPVNNFMNLWKAIQCIRKYKLEFSNYNFKIIRKKKRKKETEPALKPNKNSDIQKTKKAAAEKKKKKLIAI